ncbi:MAG TPA: aminotransferase class I/II-fold pyridoxal phosphate-dependent enzyme [Limnochordales bacterium]
MIEAVGSVVHAHRRAALSSQQVARQVRTPLLEAIQTYRREGVIRFHMPGHRGGAGADPRIGQALGRDAFALDVTGVLGLDDLHQPHGAIDEAQRLAAEAFGADRSFFLVNGTSVGVQAMILAACQPGDKLVVARNVHKSIVSGLILSGVLPVYVAPEVDEHFGIALGVTPEAVREALDRHPDARAVLLVSPTYHGITSDLTEIARIVHERGKPLLVDEAHGPHFAFHDELPLPALACGADACAQGIHKMLSGLTQASILHVRGDRLDVGRLQAVLRLLQSTSASYLLLSSIDVARMQMATAGPELLQRALELAGELRRLVRAIPGLETFGPEWVGRPGVFQVDPTKVTVRVEGLGLSGAEVERWLREHGPIQVEMSDLLYVLFIVGYGNDTDEVHRLADALAYLAEHASDHRRPQAQALLEAARQVVACRALPPVELSPREAFFACHRTVPLEQAAGCISGEVVTCYPPGVPILCPGERITEAVVEHLMVVRASGLAVSGPKDPSLRTLEVV